MPRTLDDRASDARRADRCAIRARRCQALATGIVYDCDPVAWDGWRDAYERHHEQLDAEAEACRAEVAEREARGDDE
jgi:hypothetical protein